MTVSGHIIAQLVQAMHLSGYALKAGLYPIAFTLLVSSCKIFTGHTETQSPHPLQRSVLKVTRPFICILLSSILPLRSDDQMQVFDSVFGLATKLQITYASLFI